MLPQSPKPEGEAETPPPPALPVHFRFNGVPTVAPFTGDKPKGSEMAGSSAAPSVAVVVPAPQAAGEVKPVPGGGVARVTSTPFSPEPTPLPVADFNGGRRSRGFSARGLTLLIKLLIAAAIVLIGVFVFMKTILPVMRELSHPGGAKADTKEAPTAVQIVRQTREVVAKNDSNVAYLNTILEGTESTDASKPAPAPPPSAPKPKEPEVKINLKAANRFLDELPVNGVIAGANPRIVVNGLLVNVDDVVDWRLGLVFAGVDESAHMIFFRGKDGTILRRKY